MDYLVTPPEETSWRLDPADFERALRERWPEAEVRENPEADPTYALDFSVTVEQGGVDGGFARDGQMLGLQHDVWACAAVATWFRELVPPEQPLLFYDPALNGQAELAPGLSPADLAQRYLASQR
jgi:hypothetical protein